MSSYSYIETQAVELIAFNTRMWLTYTEDERQGPRQCGKVAKFELHRGNKFKIFIAQHELYN